MPKSVTIVRAHSVSGSLTVRDVGPGVDQWLNTVSGSITTDGARDLQSGTTSGSIDFVSAGKALEARSISGSITGAIDSLEKGGSVSMRTVSGSVSVSAFDGLDASVDLRSVSGTVSCDFPVSVTTQKRTQLQGRIGQGSVPVEIRTTSGGISINKLRPGFRRRCGRCTVSAHGPPRNRLYHGRDERHRQGLCRAFRP